MEKVKCVGVETLKETVKVKFKDGDDIFFKRYEAKDIKVIRNVEKEQETLDVENLEDLEELEKLEKLEEMDKKNSN